MNIEDIRSSFQASAELAARRDLLSELAAETDDGVWIGTQEQRNTLEREVRELEQLQTRIAERERREHVEDLETAIAANLAIVEAPNTAYEELAAFVRATATQGARLLAAFHAAADVKRAAGRQIFALDRQLGRDGTERRLTPGIAFTRLQQELWEQIQADGTNDFGLQLRDLFTPMTPTSIAGWIPRGVDSPIVLTDVEPEPSRAFERPAGNAVYQFEQPVTLANGRTVVEFSESASE